MALPDRPISGPSDTPADLRDVEASLLRLARAERQAAPFNLTDRLMDATVRSLPEPRGEAPAHGSDRAIAGIIHRLLAPRIRLAAGLMLAAGAALVIFAVVRTGSSVPAAPGTGGQTVASADAHDVDAMLAAIEAVDAIAGSSSVDALIAEADTLDSSLFSDVLDTSWNDAESSGVSQ
jgi:hypothetical protein